MGNGEEEGVCSVRGIIRHLVQIWNLESCVERKRSYSSAIILAYLRKSFKSIYCVMNVDLLEVVSN